MQTHRPKQKHTTSSIASHLRLYNAGVRFIGMGLAVIPAMAAGKCPPHGLVNPAARATTDAATLAALLAEFPAADALAVHLGKSGLLVLDTDTKLGDGFASVAALESEYGALPPTFTVRTRHNGAHPYYRGARLERVVGIRPHVDLLGDGLAIICTADGAYQVTNDAPIASAPPWLLTLEKPRTLRAYCGGVVDTSAAPAHIVEEIARRLCTPRYQGRVSGDELVHRCTHPAHRDNTPSASWTRCAKDGHLKGRPALHCKGCDDAEGVGWRTLAKRLGIAVPAAHRGGGDNAQVQAIRVAIESVPWQGRMSGNNYRVLIGLWSIAQQANSVVFEASYRQIAEAAGVRKSLVQRVLKRLEAKGWRAEVESRHRPVMGMDGNISHCRATVHRLRIPPDVLLQNSEDIIGTLSSMSRGGGVDPAADEWRNPVYGVRGGRMWGALEHGPLGVGDLAAVAWCSGRHARRILTKMRRVGVVRCIDGLWRRGSVRPFDSIRGTPHDGAGARVRRGHRAERAWFLHLWEKSRKKLLGLDFYRLRDLPPPWMVATGHTAGVVMQR